MDKVDSLRTQVHSFFSKKNKPKYMECNFQNDPFSNTSTSPNIYNTDPLSVQVDPSLNGNNTNADMECQLQIDVIDKELAEKLITKLEDTMNALA